MSLDEASGLSYRPAIMLTLPSWAIVVGIIGLVAAIAYNVSDGSQRCEAPRAVAKCLATALNPVSFVWGLPF